jgi:hypothetical protein
MAGPVVGIRASEKGEAQVQPGRLITGRRRTGSQIMDRTTGLNTIALVAVECIAKGQKLVSFLGCTYVLAVRYYKVMLRHLMC